MTNDRNGRDPSGRRDEKHSDRSPDDPDPEAPIWPVGDKIDPVTPPVMPTPPGDKLSRGGKPGAGKTKGNAKGGQHATKADAPDDEEEKEDADEDSDSAKSGAGKSEKGKEDKDEPGGKSGKEKKKWSPLKRAVVIGVVGVLFLAAVIGGLLYWLHARHFESTDDAFIDGNIIRLAPQASGRVQKLAVTDNQQVKAGDLLLEIDPADYRAKLAQAKAAQAEAQGRQVESVSHRAQGVAQVEVAQASLQQMQAEVSVAEANLANAEADLKRYQQLGPQALARQTLDAATTAVRNAQSQLIVAHRRVGGAQAQVNLARSQVQAAEAEIQAADADVLAAKAQVDLADLQLSYTKVYAPVDGRVTQRGVNLGDYVQVGQDLMALVQPEVWVTANFKEAQLKLMTPGQAVEMRIDAYPDRRFRGRVDSIQQGSGARFSLLPPENATGNFVKVVQRVPVKITFEKNKSMDDIMLGPGMSVVPEVRVR